jgi:heme-degrading monooxygenase HmoA
MIIRVFEGRLKAGGEQEFMAGERTLLLRTDVEGLIGVSIGRRLSGGQMNVITLSVWQDRESIERFAQSDVDRPVFLTGSQDLVESWSLDHYEAMDSPETIGDTSQGQPG